MAVTHFVTQFTHVSRHPRVYNRKLKKNRENCFENVVSDLWNNSLCGHKSAFRKKVKNLEQLKTKNHKNAHNQWRLLDTKLVFFLWIFETTFSKQFSLFFLFCFKFLTLKCLETCVNCITKCKTAKIYTFRMKFQYPKDPWIVPYPLATLKCSHDLDLCGLFITE